MPEPPWKRLRKGRLGSHAPGAYWYGWMVRGEKPGVTDTIAAIPDREEDDRPPDLPVTTNDAESVKEMEESAFVTVVPYPKGAPKWKQPIATGPIGDLAGIDDEVAKRIIEYYQEVYEDPSGWRQARMEATRQDILKKLKSIELNEAVIEARRVVEQTKQGVNWAEDYRIEWEESIIETAGMEVPEEDRLITVSPTRMPPPGPEPSGRGAFHIMVDGSGSMSTRPDGTVMSRYEVATAIVWTFIQEAKSINRDGLSHYIGIYGCDGYFFYPVPASEYPPQPPWNPLPCGDIFMVERDFLRYWPDEEGALGRHFMGDNYWQIVLPILYLDYVKFGAGDFILIIDGDLRRDTMFLYGGGGGGNRSFPTLDFSGDAAEYYEAEWEMAIPKDPGNPSILMKLQKFMKDNECGTGYCLWVIPEGTTDFACPKCGSKWPGGIRFVELLPSEQSLLMECLNPSCSIKKDSKGRKTYRDKYMDPCTAGRRGGGCLTAGGATSCLDCKYIYLVLGDLFKNGTHVFRGTSAGRVLENIAKALHEQRISRIIKRTGGEDISLQDDEDDYQ